MLKDFYMSSFVMTRKDNFYDRSALFSCLCLLDDADLVDLPTPAIVKVRVKLINVTCTRSYHLFTHFITL